MNLFFRIESRESKVESRKSRTAVRPSILDLRLSILAQIVASLLVTVGLTASRAGAANQSVWQLTPYRVRVAVAGDSLFSSPAAAGAFCDALETQLESVVGAAWDLTVAPAPSVLRWARIESLESLPPDILLESAPDADKIIILVVASEKGILRAAARELDMHTRQLGPLEVKSVLQRAKLLDAAADAVLTTFTPLALIDSADLKAGKVVLRMKAAALPPRDRKLAFVRPGTLFQPILRYNDRDGNPRKVEPLAWTILAAESVSPEQVVCRLFSGTKTPPLARRRGRMELLALAVRPRSVPSTLRLRARAAPKPPLAGYEIFEKKPASQGLQTSGAWNDTAGELKLLGLSDLRGELTVPPDDNPLRLLVVKNGDRTLTLPLPLVQGAEPVLTAEIPSDDARLQTEGVMTSLSDDLIDTMGRRTILEVRIRSALKSGDVLKAEQLFQDLRALPDGQKFLFRLADEKKRLASSDRALQQQIDKLLAEMQKLIVKHLAAKKIDDLENELLKAREGKK